MDPIPVLVNDSECAQHIQSIVHPPLNVLKVHAHAFGPVDLQDSPGDIGPRGLAMMHYFLENFLT